MTISLNKTFLICLNLSHWMKIILNVDKKILILFEQLEVDYILSNDGSNIIISSNTIMIVDKFAKKEG